MAYKIIDIQGVGEVYSEKLRAAGIDTPEALLEKAATRRARQMLAARTGIPGALILTWANHADLFRIRGIGPQYACLLEAAGVDTIKELAHRLPENLAPKLTAAASKKGLKRPISELTAEKWIEEAKTLSPVMKY